MKEFIIQADASYAALGAVLSQIFELLEHPIAYASRLLSDAEQRYTVTEKELLAIIWAIKHFHHYVYGRRITLMTDHKPLVDLQNIKQPEGRLAKLYFKLQQHDITIKYKPGPLNSNADFLSRIKTVQLKSPYDFKQLQNDDTVI